MITIICVLLLFIQECINKIQKIDSEYKLCKQGYALSIEAINGAIWIWDDKSEKVYISNKIIMDIIYLLLLLCIYLQIIIVTIYQLK